MNASKRDLLGGGVFVVIIIVIGLIVGAIRPSKQAQAAPTIVPDIEVVQVQQQDVPNIHLRKSEFENGKPLAREN